MSKIKATTNKIALDGAIKNAEAAVSNLDLLYNEGAQFDDNQVERLASLIFALSSVHETILRSR